MGRRDHLTLLRLLASSTLMAGWAGAAYATPEYVLQTGASYWHVDNPFVFANGSNDPLKRSDSGYSLDLRGGLFLPLPTERSNLQLTGVVSQMHYGFFDRLDHTKKQFDALYTWEYSDWLRGRLQHKTDERLYNYTGGQLTNLELPHVQQNLVEVAPRITNRLDLPVTLSQQTLRYIDPSLVNLYDMNSKSAQVALRYNSGIKSTLSIGGKQTDVNFPLRSAENIAAIDSGYTDREIYLETDWRYTENTVLTGRFGTINRRFNTFHERDSNLAEIDTQAAWRYSNKTWLILNVWHKPQANEEADSRLYVISTGFLARAIYDWTPKIQVSILGGMDRQKYENFAVPGTPAVAGSGQDTLVRIGGKLDYRMTPKLTWHMEGFTEQTRSPAIGQSYRRSVAQVGFTYTFENMAGGENRARLKLENPPEFFTPQ